MHGGVSISTPLFQQGRIVRTITEQLFGASLHLGKTGATLAKTQLSRLFP